MKPAAGLADHGFIGALRIVRRDVIRQPVLHVHSGPGTFEDDVIYMAEEPYGSAASLAFDPNQCGVGHGRRSGRSGPLRRAVLIEPEPSALISYLEGFSLRE